MSEANWNPCIVLRGRHSPWRFLKHTGSSGMHLREESLRLMSLTANGECEACLLQAVRRDLVRVHSSRQGLVLPSYSLWPASVFRSHGDITQERCVCLCAVRFSCRRSLTFRRSVESSEPSSWAWRRGSRDASRVSSRSCLCQGRWEERSLLDPWILVNLLSQTARTSCFWVPKPCWPQEKVLRRYKLIHWTLIVIQAVILGNCLVLPVRLLSVVWKILPWGSLTTLYNKSNSDNDCFWHDVNISLNIIKCYLYITKL